LNGAIARQFPREMRGDLCSGDVRPFWGQAHDFCTTELFFFFHVGRNSANFAPPRSRKSFAD
jgi:hypothetical protein